MSSPADRFPGARAPVAASDDYDAQALALLSRMERRAARMVGSARRALAAVFELDAGTRAGADTRPSFPASDDLLAGLEQHVAHWADLVPAAPPLRAALARALAMNFGLVPARQPHLCAALGVDDPAVQEAYERAYGAPIATLFRGRTGAAVPADSRAVPALSPALRRSAHGPADWVDIIDDLIRQCQWCTLPMGAILFFQGDPSDAVYFVVSGRVQVSVANADGTFQPALEVGRGEVIGEMGVLTGEPRSATARPVRDTELLRLTRERFEALIAAHPRMLLAMTRVLARRLRAREASQPTVQRSTVGTIAVLPAHPNVPLASFVEHLAAALARYGSVRQLRGSDLDRALGRGTLETLGQPAEERAAIAWLNDRELRYRYVLYVCDSTHFPWSHRAIRQADRVLLVGQSDGEPQPGEMETRLLGSPGQSPGLSKHVELVLLHATSRRPSTTRAWLAARTVQAHHHVRGGWPADVERVARRLAGRAVGLVLGGGGARALAHLGALRAIQEAMVPIDYIGGTSIGALLAAAYALDEDVEVVSARAQDWLGGSRSLLTLTIPVLSFFSVRRFTAQLQRVFGETHLEDLWTPCFCTSANLSRAQPMVHEAGLIWRAVRASCALPGVFPPLLEGRDLLVDGVVINNLPVDTMSERNEGGPIIAVDVSAQRDFDETYSFDDSVSPFDLLRTWCGPLRSRSLRVPSLIRVILRSAELNSVRNRLSQVDRAALYVAPPVTQYGLFDVGARAALVAAGYEATRAALAEWPERVALGL